MPSCELDHLVVTDEDLLEAGYRTTPYDKSGNYVGAPEVSDGHTLKPDDLVLVLGWGTWTTGSCGCGGDDGVEK